MKDEIEKKIVKTNLIIEIKVNGLNSLKNHLAHEL